MSDAQDARHSPQSHVDGGSGAALRPHPPLPPPHPTPPPPGSSQRHLFSPPSRERTRDCRSSLVVRSPWTNQYDPPIEDGVLPPAKLRTIEVAANDLFNSYREMYYEGGGEKLGGSYSSPRPPASPAPSACPPARTRRPSAASRAGRPQPPPLTRAFVRHRSLVGLLLGAGRCGLRRVHPLQEVGGHAEKGADGRLLGRDSRR